MLVQSFLTYLFNLLSLLAFLVLFCFVSILKIKSESKSACLTHIPRPSFFLFTLCSLLIGVAEFLRCPLPCRVLHLVGFIEVVESLVNIDLVDVALPVGIADLLDSLLIDLAETVELGHVLGLMVSELEESGRITLSGMVRVPEQVQQISVGLLDSFNLLLVEFGCVHIKLSGRVLELVGLTRLRVTANLSDTLLRIGAFQTFNTEQEPHHALHLLLLVGTQIFIANDVDRVLAFFGAMPQHGVEVFLVQFSVEFDPPVPPLREVFLVGKLGLGSVRKRVDECCEGDEHVDGVADATDDFVGVEG